MDNPEHYLTLYASDAASGAVAEAFGNHAIWTPEILSGRPDLPGSVRALASLELERARTLDLDEPRELAERALRPSIVVSRDRETTQAWALGIWRERRWTGIRWWSRHDSRWGALGIWAVGRLRVTDVTALRADHPALVEAREALARPWSVTRGS